MLKTILAPAGFLKAKLFTDSPNGYEGVKVSTKIVGWLPRYTADGAERKVRMVTRRPVMVKAPTNLKTYLHGAKR